MSNFIEIHVEGQQRLINLDWVEKVVRMPDGSCEIYFSFSRPTAKTQDFLVPDEDYSTILAMVWGI